jgi:hypothetical protein
MCEDDSVLNHQYVQAKIVLALGMSECTYPQLSYLLCSFTYTP